MSRISGEVGDGVRVTGLHPVLHRGGDVSRGAAGAAKTGRSLEKFEICMKPLIAIARPTKNLPKFATPARASPSTPRPRVCAAFNHHGLGDLADKLKLLSRAQRWEEMPQHIDDDVLHTFVTIGTYDQIAQQAHPTGTARS